MHERSVVRALLRQVEALAAEHPASRVRAGRVRIGEFSGVEPALLRSAYDELVEETTLRGATLEAQQVPLEAICDEGGLNFRVDDCRFACKPGGSLQLTICGGEELLLESISMEEPMP